MKSLIGLAAIVIAAGTANADGLSAPGSAQAVGLFRLACLDHAGDRDGTRAFLDKFGMPRMTAEQARPFIQSRSGVVYDASARGVRLALASEDSGACTTFADHADTADVQGDLEKLLAHLALPYVVAHEGEDARRPSVHHRDYHVKIGGAIYSAVISTDNVPGHIQAFLTLVPRNPADAVPQDATLGR